MSTKYSYADYATKPVPEKGKGSRLSPKMELFVEAFMETANASEAIRRAGYKTKHPHKMGSELLRHPLVAKAVDERKAERREKSELTAEYLVNKLVDIIDSGEEKTADVLRAIELAGKSIALWKDKQELSGPDGGAIEVNQKKIEEDAADFTSRIARLADRGRAGGVVEFPDPGAKSKS